MGNSKIFVNLICNKTCRFFEKLHESQGWEFALWFFVQIAHFLWSKERSIDLLFSRSESLPLLFCKVRRERITHGRSLMRVTVSELLPLPCTKERQEQFALWHKNGKISEKLSKTWWTQCFFWANHSFFECESAIRSQKLANHSLLKRDRERIALIPLL